MRQTILTIIFYFIFKIQFGYADVYWNKKFNTSEERASFISKLNFYGTLFTEADKKPYEKFCTMSSQKASEYLQERKDFSEFDPVSAYQYGSLMTFAPCIHNDIALGTSYLRHASSEGVSDASYILGILMLSKNNISSAKNYFAQASINNHPQASYNLALIKSDHFKHINPEILYLLQSSASSNIEYAQHDEAILSIMLHINQSKPLLKTELIRIQNILKNISEKTHDQKLKMLSSHNLNLLFDDNIPQITHKKSSLHKNSVEMVENTHTESNIESKFKDFENSAVDIFNDSQNYSGINVSY